MTTASENNLASAVAYYHAMRQRDISALSRHLHPNVHFLSPMAELSGKEAVAEAAQRLMGLMQGLEIRATFADGHQVMLSYSIDFPAPIGACRAAALMTFADGLIARLELFYDARPFERT